MRVGNLCGLRPSTTAYPLKLHERTWKACLSLRWYKSIPRAAGRSEGLRGREGGITTKTALPYLGQGGFLRFKKGRVTVEADNKSREDVISKILREEFGITTERELNEAIKKLGFINLAPFVSIAPSDPQTFSKRKK